MVTPAAIAAAQYYKIGDFVTFAWNYTSLSVTPSAIDILASCRINSQLYTLALNQSVEPTGAVTWDTNEYQATATIPLLTETYTLVIYDAAKDYTASPSAGYLGAFDQFTFGMYTPQPYIPLNGENKSPYRHSDKSMLTSDRVQMRHLQRCYLRSRTTSIRTSTRYGNNNSAILLLVRGRLRRLLLAVTNIFLHPFCFGLNSGSRS